MARDGEDGAAREQEGNREGAKVRTGPSKLPGPVRAGHSLPQEVCISACLSVYFQAGLGARSPGFRPQLFFHPQTISVTLAGRGWGVHFPPWASVSTFVK